MAEMNTDDLMLALTNKLHKTLTGDNQNIKIPRNKFVTWLLPGIPFAPEDFLFCSKGLGAGKDADEDKQMYQQAFTLSKLFDFIPDINNPFVDTKNDLNQSAFMTGQDTISSVYGDILKYSQVADQEITPEQQALINKYRDLMFVTRIKKNPYALDASEEMMEVTEPTQLANAYNTKMREYLTAVNDYMDLLTDAQGATGNSPEAKKLVSAWANKAPMLEQIMNAAYQSWVTYGYKNDYEKMNAAIDQITQRSMVLYKKNLQEKFEKSKLKNPGAGNAGDFYYTTLLPGNFAAGGWTEFTFLKEDYATYSSTTTTAFKGKLLFISVGGASGTGGPKTKIENILNADSFKARFKFTQVPICRPFMDPGIFTMRGWRLGKDWFEFKGKETTISNGDEKAPVGRLVAYPTSALFVRDVTLSFEGLKSHVTSIAEQVNAGGSVGWGPFRIGGSYSNNSEKRNSAVRVENNDIKIDGMQLIGFINNFVPKCPNTNPDIKDDRFV